MDYVNYTYTGYVKVSIGRVLSIAFLLLSANRKFQRIPDLVNVTKVTPKGFCKRLHDGAHKHANVNVSIILSMPS